LDMVLDNLVVPILSSHSSKNPLMRLLLVPFCPIDWNMHVANDGRSTRILAMRTYHKGHFGSSDQTFFIYRRSAPHFWASKRLLLESSLVYSRKNCH
jgi:hypothetical protein